VTSAEKRERVPAEYFEALYTADEDPWRFASSDYERAKYAHTLATLGDRRFGRALEVGCSIGVFTAQLAARCDELVAIDVSPSALALARRRLAGEPHVTLAETAFPEEMPAGPWDLVLCSEVLYYLDPDALSLAEQRLAEALTEGATVVAVHWRPATRTYPWLGDEVHERLLLVLGRWHASDERRPRYRLDRFQPR
jgi:predicted TPR repeat methyltransferase